MKLSFALSILMLIMSCHFRKDRQYIAKIAQLPTFQLISPDSSQFINTNALPIGRPMVFFYFDPECEHCQRETQSILRHKARLKNTRIYLVTSADAASVRIFSQTLRPDTVANVMVGIDYQYSFYRSFLPPTVPYMAIYNARKELVKVYIGEADINSVIYATQNL